MIPRQATTNCWQSLRRRRHVYTIVRPTITSQMIHMIILPVALLCIIFTIAHLQFVRSYAFVTQAPTILSKSTLTMTHQETTPRVKYNLGTIPSSSDSITTNDIAEVTKHWVEHESVNEFPSPLQQKLPLQKEQSHDRYAGPTPTSVGTTAQSATVSINTKKKKKQHPPLIPNRLTNDNVLRIVTRQSEEPLLTNIVQAIVHPTMRSGHDFDINTAWIELLIHEQQMKYSSNQQNVEAIAVTGM